MRVCFEVQLESIHEGRIVERASLFGMELDMGKYPGGTSKNILLLHVDIFSRPVWAHFIHLYFFHGDGSTAFCSYILLRHVKGLTPILPMPAFRAYSSLSCL
jgi:hypothetical protein